MESFSMANLCIKTPSSGIPILKFQLLVLRPRPSEHWAQHISKDWKKWYIRSYKNKHFNPNNFFPGHSQRDWWNLLRWGIGRDLQRCKLFSSFNISVAFFISFVSTPKIIKVFQFHNFRSFQMDPPSIDFNEFVKIMS